MVKNVFKRKKSITQTNFINLQKEYNLKRKLIFLIFVSEICSLEKLLSALIVVIGIVSMILIQLLKY